MSNNAFGWAWGLGSNKGWVVFLVCFVRWAAEFGRSPQAAQRER
jgi:hypothetical protein